MITAWVSILTAYSCSSFCVFVTFKGTWKTVQLEKHKSLDAYSLHNVRFKAIKISAIITLFSFMIETNRIFYGIQIKSRGKLNAAFMFLCFHPEIHVWLSEL